MAQRAPSDGEEPLLHDEARARVIAAGQQLLAEGGRAALTTRAVSALAGVQAPTLYRLFGDMNGLLEALAEDAMRSFAQEKRRRSVRDPLDDLRVGWDMSVAFGLAHPAIYRFMMSDPRPGHLSPATAAGHEILREKLQRLAKAGLLRVPVDRALNMVRASGTGAVLTLLGMPDAERDRGLSEALREGLVAAITREAPAVDQPDAASAAIALRASLDDAESLSPGERLLLDELLARLSSR